MKSKFEDRFEANLYQKIDTDQNVEARPRAASDTSFDGQLSKRDLSGNLGILLTTPADAQPSKSSISSSLEAIRRSAAMVGQSLRKPGPAPVISLDQHSFGFRGRSGSKSPSPRNLGQGLDMGLSTPRMQFKLNRDESISAKMLKRKQQACQTQQSVNLSHSCDAPSSSQPTTMAERVRSQQNLFQTGSLDTNANEILQSNNQFVASRVKDFTSNIWKTGADGATKIKDLAAKMRGGVDLNSPALEEQALE